MRFLLWLARAIDRLNERIGRFVGWLTLAMVLIGTYNTVLRYLGGYFDRQLSSNSYIELQWYLFSLIFLLGASYTLQRNAHVRVDVLYGRLSDRGRAWIDLAGTLLLLLPFTVFALVMSYPSVRNSWKVREVSPDPDGLLRYPIKAVVLVAFALLAMQGLSLLIRQVAILRGLESADVADEARPEVLL
ncbi:MAG: TRAP transporter small permease subunit [bacterium]|nr:TRAP transporter small permease subunit [bacterium]